MKWDGITLTALAKSIRHWEENVSAHMAAEVSTSASDCALCVIYRRWNRRRTDIICDGCPVAHATGQPYCADTPYIKAHNAWDEWISGYATREDWRKAAQAELEFLKALWPAGYDRKEYSN